MLNRVFLIGYLGADPEVRQTQGGAVCNLRVATTETWRDRDGAKQDRTEWHNVTAWGAMGENCARYLAKGRQVAVEGRLQSNEWTDQAGQKRRSWSIVAKNVTFLGGGERRPAQRPASGWGNPAPTPRAGSDWGRFDGAEDEPPPF